MTESNPRGRRPRICPDDLTYERFISLRLGADAPAADAPAPAAPAPAARPPAVHADDVVLAGAGAGSAAALRRDALVVTRQADRYAVRRVAGVTDGEVELLPVEGEPADHPERLPLDSEALVGTVVMRWCQH